MRKALVLGAVAALVMTVGGTTLAADRPNNSDFVKAKEKAAQLAESLKSYEISVDLVMEQKTVGAAEGRKFEAKQRSAALMPDRLTVAIESPMFVQTWGTGPETAWFYFAQQQACFVGEPVQLNRSLASGESLGLDENEVYNFYAGVGEYLLTKDILVDAETGRETLTVNGEDVTCQIFTFDVTGGDGEGKTGHGTYWFDPSSGLVLKSAVTTISQQNGMEMEGTMASTITSFTLNGDLADDKFFYSPPEGARVVDSFDRLLNPDSMVGDSAPDISFTTFDGQKVSLKDYRGKVVFLDFWATWCGPCRMEMPHIQKLHEEMKGSGEVVFLGASNEPQATIEGWLEKNPYTFKMVLVKPEDAQNKFKVTSIPAGFVIDREGTIRAHMIGAQSEKQLRAALKNGGLE